MVLVISNHKCIRKWVEGYCQYSARAGILFTFSQFCQENMVHLRIGVCTCIRHLLDLLFCLSELSLGWRNFEAHRQGKVPYKFESSPLTDSRCDSACSFSITVLVIKIYKQAINLLLFKWHALHYTVPRTKETQISVSTSVCLCTDVVLAVTAGTGWFSVDGNLKVTQSSSVNCFGVHGTILQNVPHHHNTVFTPGVYGWQKQSFLHSTNTLLDLF